jgi:hypothetical protein
MISHASAVQAETRAHFEVAALEEFTTFGQAKVAVLHPPEYRYFPSTLRAFYEDAVMPQALWENIVAPQTYKSAAVDLTALEDCYVTPSGLIVTADGRLLDESMYPLSQQSANPHCFDGLLADDRGCVDLSQPLFATAEPLAEAIFGRELGESGYFHLMSSVLPRVLTARRALNDPSVREALRLQQSSPPILFEPWTDLGVQAMRAGGFEDQVRRAQGRVLRVGRLLFPGASQRGDSHFTRSAHLLDAYAPLRKSAVLAELPPTLAAHGGRVYISRRDAGSRQLANEDAVTGALQRMAFLDVETSSMSLAHQIALFKRMHVLVAAHGAGLVNMLFMEPGSIIIEVLPPDRIWPSYRVLAALMGHEYIAVVGRGRSDAGDFSVDPVLLGRIVESAVGDYSHRVGRRSRGP